MKEIKRRFGLHFDFHAGKDSIIGTTTNIEDIERYILDTKPDFIQCDCKGHPGISSYPTKVGNRAARYDKDNLKIWCEAAKKHGIPIFMHYSGAIDNEYVKQHPEQAELHLNKTPFENDTTCLFGSYVHDLLIPQLKELITDYGIDGVWVDGEVWGIHMDASQQAKVYLDAVETEDKKKKIMRNAFFRYVKTYVDELHEFKPDFKIMSNWLYSSYIPEKPEINVDYLSGDFVPNDSAFAVRFEARCLAVQNKPWDLMAWSFASQPYYAEKPAVQLCQEAATVLTLGGGFQMYITQNRDGSARKYENGRFKEVSKFVREREMLYGKRPIAQIGVLYSADSFYKKADIFNGRGAHDQIEGVINALLDTQYTANVVYEYQLDEIDRYDVLIIPQWDYISDENKKILADYVREGGRLAVIGGECCKQFGLLFGFDFALRKDIKALFLKGKDGMYAKCNYPVPEEKPEELPVCDLECGDGMLYSTQDPEYGILPSYRTEHVGEGSVTFIPFGFGTDYFSTRPYAYNDYLNEVLSSLVRPYIEINRKPVDITMQAFDDGIYVNLINMKQNRHSLKYPVYTEVEPICDIELTVNEAFEKIEMPLGEEFTAKVENGKTRISVKRLDIHSIIKLS